MLHYYGFNHCSNQLYYNVYMIALVIAIGCTQEAFSISYSTLYNAICIDVIRGWGYKGRDYIMHE